MSACTHIMAPGIPRTRQSLLIRVKDPDDRQAWQEFAEIYRPALYRLARRRGLQPADAEDVTQQVLVAVLQKIGEWKTDRKAGSFRAWLLTVARNALTNKLARRRRDAGRGGTSVVKQLADIPEAEESKTFQWELRRAAFRWAAAEVQGEFQESTWQAFWKTAVDREPVERAAQELGMSIGALYTARSRVLKRLREKVAEVDLAETGGE